MEMSGGSDEINGYAGCVGLVFNIDPTMNEPFQRCRANTWHGRARVDDRVTDDDRRSTLSSGVDSPAESCDSSFGALNSSDSSVSPGGAGPARLAPRKPASRKNAWGNLSYADLITQAIESSPDKRLTLAQIYDWMVTNVPFFKDKGDSNSSAGWKNSIRHNLSLHSRFMRVQNEGAGKSSWWIVNPDAVARTAKTPRRLRAFTLDTKAYERQRRSRAQRQSRDLLTAAPALTQKSAASAVMIDSASEEPKDPFGLEYRTRASSFGGRLSPIDARAELDSMDYLPVARTHYDARRRDHFPYVGDGHETLSETLADILAGDLNMSEVSSTTNQLTQPGYIKTEYDPALPYCQPVSFYHEPANDVLGCYEAGNSSHGSNSDVSSSAHYGCFSHGGAAGVGNMSPNRTGVRSRVLNVDHVATGSMPNLSQLLTAPLYHSPCMSPLDDMKPKSCMFDSFQPRVRDNAMTSSNSGVRSEMGCYSGLMGRLGEDRATSQRLDQTAVARILAERPHLLGKMQKLIEMKRQQLAAELQQPQQQQQQLVVNQPVNVDNCCAIDFHLHTSRGTIPQSTSTSRDPPTAPEAFIDPSVNSFFPIDLDLSSVDFTGAAMDCDIDQVIRHELAVDGKLDFMFDSLPTPTK